tara:strand:+ start:231 stop:1364 length:1134 start_codon:yes stop_codon:yes gene_type:complete
MKKKILTVVGTRPEIIRLSIIIQKFDLIFNNVLVHTNQNFDKNLKDVFFKELNIRKPDYDLNILENTNIKFISSVLTKIEKIIIKEKPDAFFVLGDTNSSLSSIVAKKYKIPVFHYEAGNRCFDERVPEEINRRLVDHISDINLTYSDFAKKNLLNEGITNERVIKVGSPLFEVINFYRSKIEKCKILNKLKLKKNNYILISYHREENVDLINKLKKFINLINIIQKKYGKKIIISTHPRTKKKLDLLSIKKNKNINFLKPLSYFEYMKLQINSYVTLSDSGSISEESSILKFKAITLRNSFERQEIMSQPSILVSDLNKENLISSIDSVFKLNSPSSFDDYSIKNISDIIPKIILSYIPYIKNTIWRMDSNENSDS